MKSRTFFQLIGWSMMVCATFARAADFSRVDFQFVSGMRSIPAIEISGEILPGDDVQFAAILREHRITETHLVLNSPGGNLATAVRLATVIRDYGFMTAVAKDAQCLSACFVLYAAGFTRQGQAADDTRHQPSARTSIGVHRAYEPRASMRNKTPEQARASTSAAQAAMAKALRKFDVPAHIVEKVNSVASNEMEYLTRAEVTSMTVPPWMEELSYAKCGFEQVTGEAGKAFEDLQRMMKIIDCQYQVLIDHRSRSSR